jgi:hypothetical protein
MTEPGSNGASLTCHRYLHVGLVVGDQVTGEVDRHAVDGAGEGEAVGLVVGCDAASPVMTAGEPLGTEDARDGVRHVNGTDQLAVDVQLAAGRHTLASREVSLSGRLQFVT